MNLEGMSQGSQGISFPILILVSLVCYGNLITDNGKVTLRSTCVSRDDFVKQVKLRK